MERIFVQIASYRDPECQWTLKDLFEKAAHPERVFAGVCWIADEAEDKDCFIQPVPYPAAQVRTILFRPDEENGINWARMQAQSLSQGEDYVLQIHSHMRFEKDWDNLLIAQLARCPAPKPVISTSPPAYTPPDIFPYRAETRSAFTTVYSVNPEDSQILSIAGKLISKETPIPQLMRNAFAVGCFLFARSQIMDEVPFDPHVYYYNSELSYSARLWTHGYDIFQPDVHIVFHWYGRTVGVPRPYREIYNHKHAPSLARVLHMLRLRLSTKGDVLEKLDRYGLGLARSIDEYWEFAGINPLRPEIAEHARKGLWENALQAIARRHQAGEPKHPTIFVQIASYRDPECQWTVKDLFDKATRPDNVRIGICWQYDPDEDEDCFEVSVRPDQVRIAPFHWKESQGVCWARHQAQLLFEDEDYVLMIDSHMRFVFGWDELLIRELERCTAAKPVLSNHPASYTPPHELEANPFPTALCVQPFTTAGDIRVHGGFMRMKPLQPLHGALIAAGFVFTKGKMVREVPYDPYLYFNQEEISISARLFTHGWDVFHPSIVTAYHCYNVGEETKKRKLHWQDNRNWNALQERAKKRFDHLLDYEVSDDPLVVRDLVTYGLGDERTLAAFEEFTGIDFKQRTTNDKAVNYGFTPELRRYMRSEPPATIAPGGVVSSGGGLAFSFPDPAQSAVLPFNVMQMANGEQRILDVDTSAPKDVLIINGYVEQTICDAIARYADSQTFTDLGVVDFGKTDEKKIAIAKNDGRVTNHVDIDGMAGEILTICNDIYCNRVAPFYGVNFEWYERPQILRYPAGGKYNQHADADHWVPEKNEWIRVQDRDYSVLLYLNDEYTGGELQFVNQNFTIKPKPGMLVAFPSDHKFLHAALPTTSGIRYVIVSWAAILGTRRVRPQMPYASVFVRQKRKMAG